MSKAVVTLSIDNREHKLLALLTNKYSHLKHETIVMDIGDVQISIHHPNDNNNNSQNDSAGGNPRADSRTFERKTLEDLEASVKDGRYHEQKKRAASNGIALTYILEGAFTFGDKNASSKMLTGCVINTIMRDKIPIIFTRSLEETAAFLDCMMTRVITDPNKYIVHDVDRETHDIDTLATSSYVGTICLKKKENVNPATCYILQLACIPGISKSKAMAIATHHADIKSMSDLCSRLAGQKPEKFFKDTPGIGKGIAKAIYTFCGIE
jgi:crossover junction endonuclease MUS81